ncbi:hypothetical protein [Xanthomonas melonis]|uniref:hypothetical protein n=1 Tax=Xanthomonas melonis TaxID=56456 RepID=UPI003EB7A7D9
MYMMTSCKAALLPMGEYTVAYAGVRDLDADQCGDRGGMRWRGADVLAAAWFVALWLYPFTALATTSTAGCHGCNGQCIERCTNGLRGACDADDPWRDAMPP